MSVARLGSAGLALWLALALPAAAQTAAPPAVRIDRVETAGLSLAPGPALQLPSRGVHSFRIFFEAVAAVAPANVEFQSRLDPFDADWGPPTSERSARYESIPPGQYRFEVRARTASGPWGPPAELELALPRRPGLWIAWQVVLALALAGLAVLLGLQRGRRRRLEALVEARTQELAASHRALQAAQTDLVRAERLASVATLVRGIAHELNNPLGFIAGNIAPLQRYGRFLGAAARRLAEPQPLDPAERARLLELAPGKDLAYVIRDLEQLTADLAEGARRAQLIVSDLYALTAAPQRAWERVDLVRAARQSAALLAPRTPPGVELAVDAPAELLLTARAGQLEQVLVNLLDNALRAVGERGRITVRLAQLEQGARLEVEDDGCGMPAEVRARALEPFFTTRAVGEGSGLGLAIVESIVADHGGRLELQSSPGSGTRVQITLPAEPPGASAS